MVNRLRYHEHFNDSKLPDFIVAASLIMITCIKRQSERKLTAVIVVNIVSQLGLHLYTTMNNSC